MHRWWLSKCMGDIPDRSEFDPADFKKLLPNILVADIEHSPFRVRYRLVGTRVVDATGFEITGRYLDELMPTEPEARWLDLYEITVKGRCPTLGTSTCTTTSGGLFTHEFGMFPLRKGGGSVDQVLSIEDYGDLWSTLTDLIEWRLQPQHQKIAAGWLVPSPHSFNSSIQERPRRLPSGAKIEASGAPAYRFRAARSVTLGV